MKGVILQKGLRCYTRMSDILEPTREDFKRYNWLITDYEGGFPNERLECKDYIWMAGEELLDLIHHFDIHFTWAVFSAIPKNIPLDQVLKTQLPYADGYPGFWVNPLSLQHPLAEMEIVPWDGYRVLIISNEHSIIDWFRTHFPFSEDLEEYNAQFAGDQ